MIVDNNVAVNPVNLSYTSRLAKVNVGPVAGHYTETEIIRGKIKLVTLWRRGIKVRKKSESRGQSCSRKRAFEIPGFRVVLAMASLPGMTIKLFNRFRKHHTGLLGFEFVHRRDYCGSSSQLVVSLMTSARYQSAV